MDSQAKKHLGYRIALLLALVVLVAASALRIYLVNTAFPPAQVMTYELGELIPTDNIPIIAGGISPADGIHITALGSYFLTPQQVQEILPTMAWPSPDRMPPTDGSAKVFVATLTVINDSDAGQRLDVSSFHVQTGVWSNGLNFQLFNSLNSNVGLFPLINPHQELTLNFPYFMYKHLFANAEDWANVEMRDYKLILSSYPVQNVIHLRDASL
jgi:hypothetical protein